MLISILEFLEGKWKVIIRFPFFYVFLFGAIISITSFSRTLRKCRKYSFLGVCPDYYNISLGWWWWGGVSRVLGTAAHTKKLYSAIANYFN